MCNLSNFKMFDGSVPEKASVLCWSKDSGYYFCPYYSYILGMQENGNFKVIGVEKLEEEK